MCVEWVEEQKTMMVPLLLYETRKENKENDHNPPRINTQQQPYKPMNDTTANPRTPGLEREERSSRTCVFFCFVE